MKKSLRKRIRIRSPALIALLVLLGILAGTIPAYAWSDSGLPIPKDTPVTVTGSKPWQDNKQWYYIGVWTIHISGAKNGTGQVAMGQTYKDPVKKLYGEGYCFVDDTNTQAIEGLNGNPTFVNNNKGSHQALLNWGSGWDRRTYIGYFLELCGAQFLRWEKGHVYVRATEKPNANLTLPSTIRTGQSAKIGISGSSFVPSDSPYRNISWVLKVNGSTVDSGQGSMSFNKQVSHTFTSANSTIRLEVTDGVGRTTVVERNASGQSPPTPPPPPTSGGSQGPVADFSMPRNAEIGEAVTITDMSYHPGGGTIVDRQWMLYPNDYTGYLSGTGSTLRFNSEGTYDVVLIVKDNNNRMDSAEKQIHIGPPPPPPPPPEPENDPPVARFTMPSVASPGETVNVVNESYDPDGYLTVIQWNVTPSDGVTNNLGDFGGTLIFDQTGTYEVEVFVVDDFGDYDEYSREISIENQAPVAKILAPDKALQGEDIEIKSASYDPDGTIEKITWSVAPDGMVGILTGEGNTVYFDQPGTYTITLTVEDNHGEASTATVQIEVLPAVPQAFFVDEGPYKQNRKLTLIEQGITSARYPIVKEQDEWQIVPAGGGATSEAIKINKVAPDKLEVLFRTAGIYKVSLRVTNSAGNQSEWYERTFNILEDKPPVADFSVAEFVTRDLANNKKATIMPRDTSYSPDGDIIVERIWKYRYDSNNDGSFEDEAWAVFSNTNEMTPSFETDQVGKYQIELEVTEGFGEETLAEYITPSDYLKGDTSEKPLNEKRAEVINMSPLVSFQAFQKHLVDVAIVGNAGAVWEFDFTGAPQTWTVPDGVTSVRIEAWGAQGGDTYVSGGPGAYVSGILKVTPGQKLNIYIGGKGGGGRPHGATGGAGGWNGGGAGTSDKCTNCLDHSAGGGGATDIRIGGTALSNRVLVAGGGGGSAYRSAGGSGGAPNGENGEASTVVGSTDSDAFGGSGGTLTSGGAGGVIIGNPTAINGVAGTLGVGGSVPASYHPGAGGGGGYYGGGSGAGNQGSSLGSAGGGGSSYTSPSLTSPVMRAGVRQGDGYVRITQLDNSDGSADSIAQALEGQLKSANLDAKVSTYAITQPETQTTFPWVAYNLYGKGFGSGDGQFDISSNNYVYKGYGSEAPIDHVYYEDGSYERRYFNFDIDMTGYNACAVTIPGFIFGATDKSGFKGYIALMWHDQVGVYYFSGNDHTILTKNGAGQIASNRSPSSFGGNQIWVGPTVTTSLQKSFQFVYSPGTKELKVFNDGVLLDTISCPNAAGNGYGIAVANSSHNCGARSYVRFNNVSLVSGEATPLDEVVRSASWRDNAHKFVFDMSMVDHQTQVLDSPGALGRLLSSLLTRDIDYSVTNSPFDETAARNIITMNDDNGAWFPLSGNMPQLIQDYGLYIITKILGLSSLTNYIILNEEVYYEAHYSDAEEDPKYSERWRYNHDPNYFENSLGRASYDGQWLPTPIYRFDKVGKFNITFQAQDNPKDDERFAEYRMWSSTTQDDLEIYVHRKPVASFKTTMNPAGQDSIVFTENFESANSIFDFSGNWIRTNIKARTGSWSYRNAPIGNYQTSTSQFTVEVPAGATNAKLSFYYYVSSQMPSGCDYGYDVLNIYLDGTRIVNASGESGWIYVERSLSAGNHTVRFEYTKSGGSDGSNAGFVDDIALSYLAPRFNVDINNISAYDLDHMSLPNKGIVEHRWSWKPPTGIAWTTGAGPPSLQIGQGQDYLLRYEVKDMEGAWSNPCIVYLTLEQQPPIAQFTITPNPVVVGSQVTINDTSYDPNGDPITERLWSTRHNGGPWSPHTSTPPASFDKAGTWEVELVVKDHSLWSEPCVQTVTVLGNTRPVARFTVSPNPAYDYETLYYEDTSYDPDGDPIGAREWRVSKDGGAWQYYATPPTTLPAGNYVIELRVQDIPQHPMLEPLWSEWYGQTLTVKESFEIVGQVTPNPAERGRKIRITAYAQRIGTGEKIQISEVKAYIPHPTKPDDTPALPGGTTPVVVNMSWDNAIKGYVYDYLLPDKTVDGRWTDDGTYYIRVVGKQGEVEKEALLPVQIRGHILQRVYIRTDKW